MLKSAAAAALVLLSAAVTAYPWGYYDYWVGWPYYYGNPYYGGGFWEPYFSGPGSGKLLFYGQFKDSCEGGRDGLYYVDQANFAFCTHGRKVVQPCAEGSANPEPDYFQPGHYYSFREFCSVNLVAKQGYKTEPEPVTTDISAESAEGY